MNMHHLQQTHLHQLPTELLSKVDSIVQNHNIMRSFTLPDGNITPSLACDVYSRILAV